MLISEKLVDPWSAVDLRNSVSFRGVAALLEDHKCIVFMVG